HTYGMSLPIGIVGCAYLLAIAVQTEIKKTYDERDFLRENLEKEVELKTKQLRESEFDLKKTLIDLKHTQAELVQSAKMASLGTLSAGIAHEINNSLNFVNGALPPLKKLGEKLATEKEKSLFNRLLEALQDGVHLTLEIVTSLRDYSGLNHSSVKDLHVLEVLNSVITILKGRIQGDVKVVVNVPADIYVVGSVAGLSQIFMNLLTNALDAVGSEGMIEIVASRLDRQLEISVTDNGVGISESVINRIWDPFFTTKDVGRGTGLGLYIVRNEVARFGGQILVQSKTGAGTTFLIKLPISEMQEKEIAA
ncbi:MAG: ATP-binding protein, partial [Bdellovibrionia bacterium]